MSKRKNNFDIIRLIAAALVIISHTIGDRGYDDPLSSLTGYFSMGVLGVFIFFLISGYLITMSWVKNKNFINFYVNRVLRIFPGLVVVVVFSIFVIGPLFTKLPLSGYFSSSQTWTYFFNLTLLKLQYALPGTFMRGDHEATVNPPLWTLIFEFVMYIIVSLFGVLGLLNKNKIYFVAFVGACLAIIGIYSFTDISPEFYLLKICVRGFVEFFSYFFLGALFYFFQDKIKIKWWMLILLGVAWYFCIGTFMFKLINLIFIAGVVFFVAFHKKQIGLFITRHGDFSYGMYLYGSLSSNMIQYTISPYLTDVSQVILALVFTVPFAMASWYLIESRALKFKK